MAEYAGAQRCVRAAAEGFSPGRLEMMPDRKARRGMDFDFMLENGARKRKARQQAPCRNLAGGNRRKRAKGAEK